MKIPLNWLSEFVDISNISHTELNEQISLKAFEVESIEANGPELTGPLVAGEIIEITSHPNADKLQVTKTIVEPGADPLQIVCGAKNIEIGQIVPVALPGSTVLNRKTGELFPIKKSKVRDVESLGMLCSADELGLESDADGIYILPGETLVGTDLIQHLNLTPEYIIDIESRSNREDALCVQGYAREVAAALGGELKVDHYGQDYQTNYTNKIKGLENNIQVSIEDYSDCPGALFARFSGVKVTESPEHIRQRIEGAGLSSVNNIVDILNYVMLEIGQPMHAYDAEKFTGAINIRKAKDNETKFSGLDEGEYQLSPERSLMITADNKLGCIAGVMGSMDTCITENTTEVLLEIACFNPATIRKSSRQSGVASESSRRYERGTNLELLKIAFLRVSELIEGVAGGELASHTECITPTPPQPETIPINLNDYQKLIGMEISKEHTLKILQTLGFRIKEDKGQELSVSIPIYRIKDITRPVDIYEELARFQGLNEIPLQPLPSNSKLHKFKDPVAKVRELLTGQGYNENWSSSLVAPIDLELSSNPKLSKPVTMKNPLSQDYSCLRNSLIPSLLKAVRQNQARQNFEVNLFEIGKVYGHTESPTNEKETGAQEIRTLGIISSHKAKAKKLDWQE